MSAETPNIVLIMCDQLSAAALSLYDGPVITPNIERLANEGAVFDNAICPAPTCSPSRASLVTGLYPHAHGIFHNVNQRDYPAAPTPPPTEEGLLASDVTTEALLAARGYHTEHIGKWHLTDDDLPYYPTMYREHIEYLDEMCDTFAIAMQRPEADRMRWYDWTLPVNVCDDLRLAFARLHGTDSPATSDFIAKMGRLDMPLDSVYDVRVAKRAVATIEQQLPEPFMLTVSFNYPHDPNTIPSPYYESFDPAAITLPETFEQCDSYFDNDKSRRFVRDLGEPFVREFLRIYYASVRLVDDLVGQVIDALQGAGYLEDTIVVFTSDHGEMIGAHGMIWKNTAAFYDELVRVPLVIRYPAKITPGRYQLSANLVDIMPTLLDLTDTPIPDHIHGHSLLPYIGAHPASDIPMYTVCERMPWHPTRQRDAEPTTPGQLMLRSPEAKYCRYPDGYEMLFDLRDDPLETRNVADEPAYSVQLDEMRHILRVWLSQTTKRA